MRWHKEIQFGDPIQCFVRVVPAKLKYLGMNRQEEANALEAEKRRSAHMGNHVYMLALGYWTHSGH